jgi:hypothetical protein
LSIARISVTVDIGESLSVAVYDLDAAVLPIEIAAFAAISVEFLMPLTANVPCTPHRAPADLAAGTEPSPDDTYFKIAILDSTQRNHLPAVGKR